MTIEADSHWRQAARACAGLAGVFALVWSLISPAWGGQMYSYEDEKGTTVITNVWDSIPESARGNAKVIQVPDGNGVGSLFSGGGSSDGSVLDQVKSTTQQVATTLTERATTAGEKAPSQESTVYTLIVSGVLGVLMLAVLKLSSNPSMKTLMKWLLVLLVLGTAAEIYFSQVGQGVSTAIMQKVRGASSAATDSQHDKADPSERKGSGGK